MPEYLWLGLLADRLGERESAVAGSTLAHISRDHEPQSPKPAFALTSDYSCLTSGAHSQIMSDLEKRGLLRRVSEALCPLLALYTDCPLAFLLKHESAYARAVDLDTALATLKRVSLDMLDRRGRLAMIAQTTAVHIRLAAGELRIPKGTPFDNLDAIFDYPDTEDSTALASLVRATLTVPTQVLQGESPWCSYFWRHGYDVSVCEFHEEPDVGPPAEDDTLITDLLRVGSDFRLAVVKEVTADWTRARIDLSAPLKSEVLGALLARQVRFATAVAGSPDLWAVDVGRIVLRCMVDTHITLAWLIRQGTNESYNAFVEYGLGQEKLLLEHLRSRLDETDLFTAQLKERIHGMKQWIDAQLMTELLPVNVGAWSGKNTRDMAEEAGCKDIYDLSYSPHSAVLHGAWNAIARTNLRFCANPLHRLHRVPSFREPPLLLESMIQAVEVLRSTLTEWRAAFDVPLPDDPACGNFLKQALGRCSEGQG